MKSKLLLVFLLGVLVSNAGDNSRQLHAQVSQLINAEEFKGEQHALLRRMPIEALPVIESVLQEVEDPNLSGRAVAMLATKYEQFEGLLNEAEKSKYARAVVEKSRKMPAAQLQSTLSVIQKIKHREVQIFAELLLNAEDSIVRDAAKQLIEKQKENEHTRK